ncbi:hypothetical protein NE237_004506 [Protea cynaroides]|uniref:non-specific serine/threonine protein kinase n=1 Tax=Protea cynaroides TaxID=273540 RepID=A0A9Q0KIW3_9MAGN|nr:hypothetical protein NE237_004506 [Protea cynaroides]
MVSLVSLDLLYNGLEGIVPSNSVFRNASSPQAFTNNKGLCGEFQGTVFLVFAIIGVLFLSQEKVKKGNTEATKRNHDNIFSIWDLNGNMAYEDINKATEDFDVNYCIGTETFGSVYKVVLPTSHIVALKKFHPLEGEEIVDEKSFANEIRVLL